MSKGVSPGARNLRNNPFGQNRFGSDTAQQDLNPFEEEDTGHLSQRMNGDSNPFDSENDTGRNDSINDDATSVMFNPAGLDDRSDTSTPPPSKSTKSEPETPMSTASSKAERVLSATQQFMREMGVKWQDDDTATVCKVCGSKFTTFVRRHHCRLCGGIVCGGCSGQQLPVPGFEHMGKQRTCDNCVNHLIERMMSSARGLEVAKEVLHNTNKQAADLKEELEQTKGTLQTQTKELERKNEELAAVSAKLTQALDSLRAKIAVNENLHVQLGQKDQEIARFERALKNMEAEIKQQRQRNQRQKKTVKSLPPPPPSPPPIEKSPVVQSAYTNPFDSASSNPFDSDSVVGTHAQSAPATGPNASTNPSSMRSGPSDHAAGDLSEPLLDPVSPHPTPKSDESSTKSGGCCCVLM